VAALAANGNNASSGDAPGLANFSWTFGCSARELYADLDRDGYGSVDVGHRLGCTGDPPPPGFAALPGDCDENDERVRPNAVEVCNGRDDDCDGLVDEDAAPVMVWPDADGDGYYPQQAGEPKLGCGNLPGYAPNPGDCNDADAAIHPGTPETCNGRDDDCDGQVDELVRPQCGLGWCARYSTTCDPTDCHAGPPALELCNRFDDDCDGEDDNGACLAAMGGSPANGATNSPTNDATPGPTPQTNRARSASSCSLGPPASLGGWGVILLAAGLLSGVRAQKRSHKFGPG
jgi:hypothetical protein